MFSYDVSLEDSSPLSALLELDKMSVDKFGRAVKAGYMVVIRPGEE